MRRYGAFLAGLALLGAAACGEAEAGDVEPLPALQRPTPEQRAGLPVVSGRWVFTGFEYDARDTLRVRELIYRLVPPGEFRVLTQRLDSIAGQYVREGRAFPFTGEVRRDGIFAFVAFDPTGLGSFASGHVVKDTMWLELTSFASAQEWPPKTRAAFVRQPRGAPFVRLRNFVPPPPDTARADSAAAPPPPAPAPAPAPVEPRPQPRPPVAPPPPPPPPPEEEELDTLFEPPPDTPRRAPPRRGRPQPRDTLRFPPPPPPAEPEPDPEPSPLPPRPVPRDTLRIPG